MKRLLPVVLLASLGLHPAKAQDAVVDSTFQEVSVESYRYAGTGSTNEVVMGGVQERRTTEGTVHPLGNGLSWRINPYGLPPPVRDPTGYSDNMPGNNGISPTNTREYHHEMGAGGVEQVQLPSKSNATLGLTAYDSHAVVRIADADEKFWLSFGGTRFTNFFAKELDESNVILPEGASLDGSGSYNTGIFTFAATGRLVTSNTKFTNQRGFAFFERKVAGRYGSLDSKIDLGIFQLGLGGKWEQTYLDEYNIFNGPDYTLDANASRHRNGTSQEARLQLLNNFGMVASAGINAVSLHTQEDSLSRVIPYVSLEQSVQDKRLKGFISGKLHFTSQGVEPSANLNITHYSKILDLSLIARSDYLLEYEMNLPMHDFTFLGDKLSQEALRTSEVTGRLSLYHSFLTASVQGGYLSVNKPFFRGQHFAKSGPYVSGSLTSDMGPISVEVGGKYLGALRARHGDRSVPSDLIPGVEFYSISSATFGPLQVGVSAAQSWDRFSEVRNGSNDIRETGYQTTFRPLGDMITVIPSLSYTMKGDNLAATAMVTFGNVVKHDNYIAATRTTRIRGDEVFTQWGLEKAPNNPTVSLLFLFGSHD